MKNKAFKIVLALLFVFTLCAFVGVLSANTKVYAEEIVDSLGTDEEQEQGTESQEEETTESNEQTETTNQEVTLTEEEKGKLDKIVEWLSNLNKDELMGVLETAKGWLIAGGIVTVITVLSAIIGLIASILKLSREKTKNSNLSEENKKKILDVTDSFEKKLIEGNNQIKALLLEFVNNMSDEDKKKMEANIEDVRTKITKALEESNKTE